MGTLLIIDNYDSFTYNLVQMFRRWPLNIEVFRNDAITIHGAKAMAPDYILVSPGPRDPAHAGISKELIKQFYRAVPILGVCLGMQCMNEVFGGRTVRAPFPVHGKAVRVVHDGQFIFQGLASPFMAARYHSLSVRRPDDDTEDALVCTAKSEDGVVMGLSHKDYPLHGVQFHPESFLTQFGYLLVDNFLNLGSLKKQEPFPSTRV